MEVEVELVGEGSRSVTVADDATYADLLAPFDLSVHEVSVIVDGRPVPADRPVSGDDGPIQVVRLVTGG